MIESLAFSSCARKESDSIGGVGGKPLQRKYLYPAERLCACSHQHIRHTPLFSPRRRLSLFSLIDSISRLFPLSAKTHIPVYKSAYSGRSGLCSPSGTSRTSRYLPVFLAGYPNPCNRFLMSSIFRLSRLSVVIFPNPLSLSAFPPLFLRQVQPASGAGIGTPVLVFVNIGAVKHDLPGSVCC